MNIIVLTDPDCDWCESLKKKLKKNNIPFLDVDINIFKELWDEVVEKVETEVTPITLIKQKDEEYEIIVPGVDYQTEDELIKKLNTYLW